MAKSKVAIVFPVYNGAKTLERSLQCIAAQDYADFRAFILENVSTDGTVEIAKRFCSTDPRFSLISNDVHLSALDNFAKAVKIGSAAAEFFCLRACDDMSSENYLSSLMGALENDRSKLLAAGSTTLISPAGTSRIKRPSPDIFDFRGRFTKGIVPRNLTFPAEWIYGLFRSDGAEEILNARWYELGNPWCFASYVVSEFVVRDLVAYMDDASYHFYEGSGSEKKYGAKTFRDRFSQRMIYTFGCYKLIEKLPPSSVLARFKFLRMCWNDARRKTRYKQFWIF